MFILISKNRCHKQLTVAFGALVPWIEDEQQQPRTWEQAEISMVRTSVELEIVQTLEAKVKLEITKKKKKVMKKHS
jgi:hypothetical protein